MIVVVKAASGTVLFMMNAREKKKICNTISIYYRWNNREARVSFNVVNSFAFGTSFFSFRTKSHLHIQNTVGNSYAEWLWYMLDNQGHIAL